MTNRRKIAMLDSLTMAEWVVLKSAAGDEATLEDVYQKLHRTSQAIPLSEVANTIHALVEKGLLGVRLGQRETPATDLSDLSWIWKASFAVTSKGRESLTVTAPSPTRSRFGAWRDHGIELKAEDLAEVRREMWHNFPREFAE
jgi:hypothetical protein